MNGNRSSAISPPVNKSPGIRRRNFNYSCVPTQQQLSKHALSFRYQHTHFSETHSETKSCDSDSDNSGPSSLERPNPPVFIPPLISPDDTAQQQQQFNDVTTSPTSQFSPRSPLDAKHQYTPSPKPSPAVKDVVISPPISSPAVKRQNNTKRYGEKEDSGCYSPLSQASNLSSRRGSLITKSFISVPLVPTPTGTERFGTQGGFAYSYITARHHHPSGRMEMIVVRDSKTNAPVAFGPPCSWSDGVAEKIVKEEYKISYKQFNGESKVDINSTSAVPTQVFTSSDGREVPFSPFYNPLGTREVNIPSSPSTSGFSSKTKIPFSPLLPLTPTNISDPASRRLIPRLVSLEESSAETMIEEIREANLPALRVTDVFSPHIKPEIGLAGNESALKDDLDFSLTSSKEDIQPRLASITPRRSIYKEPLGEEPLGDDKGYETKHEYETRDILTALRSNSSLHHLTPLSESGSIETSKHERTNIMENLSESKKAIDDEGPRSVFSSAMKIKDGQVDEKQGEHKLQIPDRKFISDIVISVTSERGTRPSMEDTHFMDLHFERHYSQTSLTPIQSQIFAGVYDGHGGVKAAEYCRDHLYRNVAACVPNSNDDLCESLTKGFVETDMEIEKLAETNAEQSGSTGVVVIIRDNRLFVASCGDSRAVLCRGGEAVDLTIDHKPTNENERIRATQAGAEIDYERLNGELSVSRAFGDFRVNEKTGHCEKMKGLIAVPEVKKYYLTEEDEFLIIACDGLWDVLSSENAVKYARRRLRYHNDLDRVSTELVEESLRLKSDDNVTVMVIGFSKLDTSTNDKYFVPPFKSSTPPPPPPDSPKTNGSSSSAAPLSKGRPRFTNSKSKKTSTAPSSSTSTLPSSFPSRGRPRFTNSKKKKTSSPATIQSTPKQSQPTPQQKQQSTPQPTEQSAHDTTPTPNASSTPPVTSNGSSNNSGFFSRGRPRFVNSKKKGFKK